MIGAHSRFYCELFWGGQPQKRPFWLVKNTILHQNLRSVVGRLDVLNFSVGGPNPPIPRRSRVCVLLLSTLLPGAATHPSLLLPILPTTPARSAPAVRSAGLALATRRWERAPARTFPHRTAKCQEPETFLPFESAEPR